jgi:hypothetical protein
MTRSATVLQVWRDDDRDGARILGRVSQRATPWM